MIVEKTQKFSKYFINFYYFSKHFIIKNSWKNNRKVKNGKKKLKSRDYFYTILQTHLTYFYLFYIKIK